MTNYKNDFDIIIIGAGHAGCEAALASSRMGCRVLLLTFNPDHTAQMSCNPAIGGIAKGQLVREVDALGGEMGINSDAACIQFRMLNRSKGPAVWSPRAQCDKMMYQYRMKCVLERQPNLSIRQTEAINLHTAGNRITAVSTTFGRFRAQAVVIATGTFLNGILHYGDTEIAGGRAGDQASTDLSTNLADDLRLQIGRLKTGTPPRVLASSINFDVLERQDADKNPGVFSYRRTADDLASPRFIPGQKHTLPCYLTSSTEQTARIVRTNLHLSPMYAGSIQATGTRYCPSFEDKIVRFPQRIHHQIYLEPEGLYTDEYYVNGLSTSLPPSVQVKILHSIPGLEKASVTRYGYAIAYDFVLPFQLSKSLALQSWPNLFLAGQINGTSGYEEAAAQGIIAGINAARQVKRLEKPLIISRDQGYIGVLIDDLTTKDISEPYRMFTSRAENRLLLRQDNADRRLMPIGYTLGLVSRPDYEHLCNIENVITDTKKFLCSTEQNGTTLWTLLAKYGYSYNDLRDVPEIPEKAKEQITIEAHYETYIQRELKRTAQLRRLEFWHIPPDFNYNIDGIRTEAKQKLEQTRPETLAQAFNIDAVTPAEISLLQVHIARYSAGK